MPLFRLTAVLKLREQARDERRRELAQGFEAERLLRARSEEVQQEIEAVRNRTRQSAGQGSVNVEDLLSARRYELVMKSQVTTLNTQIQQVLEEIERRRQALVEADRDVKSLEKLKDRQAIEHAAIQAKQEARQLDEAALRGFAQRETRP